MNAFIRYAAISLFAAASIGIVACNNNSKSLQSGAPGATDQLPEGAVPVDTPVASESGLIADNGDGTGQYKLMMLDQNRGEVTFQVEGKLKIGGSDLQLFKSVNQPVGSAEYTKVVRTYFNGKTRDVAFYFGWDENKASASPEFYIEHQDFEGAMYRGYFPVPSLDKLSSEKGISKDELMRNLGAFIVSKTPQIMKPGIQYPEGHNLSVDIMEEWVAQL